MHAILVFIDGTICDTRQRHNRTGSEEFYTREAILKDRAVPGSPECLTQLAEQYAILYLGARPDRTREATLEWLKQEGFPEGSVYLGETQSERLKLVKMLAGTYSFLAGIGDRWDDNILHEELGCLSIILQEYTGQWETVADRIDRFHRKQIISRNFTYLEGKVEGLARVCTLLLEKYGDDLWEVYQSAVMELAERTRDERRKEDLESFTSQGFNPNNMHDIAKWIETSRETDWKNNPVYGLQDFEQVLVTDSQYNYRVNRCAYAELWKAQGKADIGYQIHCRTDSAWWDKPAWNQQVRFKQPKTLMQGDNYCLFCLRISENYEG